jgi:hypothetical protein
VWRSGLRPLRKIPLICLNDLSEEPHNLPAKLFASKKTKRIAAAKKLKELAGPLPEIFRSYLNRFVRFLFGKGGVIMDMHEELMTEEDEGYDAKLTPEEAAEMAALLASLMPPEDRMKGLRPEERVKGLRPEEVLSVFRPEEVLSVFRPEEVLSVFRPEEIEAYLQRLRKEQEQAS